MPPRKPKSSKADQQNPVREKALYKLAPWSCKHYHDHSEIEAYVMSAGNWQTIATVRADVRQTASINAEQMAEYIARTVNSFDETMDMLDEMITALEMCLECKDLNWSSEYEADIVLRRAKLMRKAGTPPSGNA